MAFEKVGGEEGRGFAPRPMVKGDWKCSECGTSITELPFEPAPDRPIYCRDCWSKKRNQFKR
jgi:CxxC-x17-CxxC domain-containing protein